MSALDDELAAVTEAWQFEKCPRCLGPLRKFVWDRGAMSRADENLTVCGLCGSDEAIRAVQAHEIVLASSWPILNGPHDYAPEADPEIAAQIAAMSARNATRS